MKLLIILVFGFYQSLVYAIEVGEEVEISSAPVTALICAKEAVASGKLEVLSACPYEEALNGYVVFDVAEKQIYTVAPKNIQLFELEKAFGGGSVDLSGKVIGKRNGIPEIEVKEYSVTSKPKAGGFKGCL